jgi:Zn-dependent alcohol dehydrogenase
LTPQRDYDIYSPVKACLLDFNGVTMAALKTKAAIAYGVGKPWAVQEIEVLPPQANEVLVRIVASGLCHSDYHALTGDVAPEFPTVGGHEGSGIIEAVGPGVTRVEPGDHIVFSFVPSCGVCRFCASGMQNLCDDNANAMLGLAMDGTYRARVGQENLRTSASIGTFRGYGTVPETMVCKVPADIPLEVACLVRQPPLAA